MEKMIKGERGLSLLEMVVAISIVVILAGIVVPIANNLIRDAKVAKVVDLFQSLSKAYRQYYVDTGQEPVHLDDFFHFVQNEDEPEGWNGPYIDRYIDKGDSPSGSSVELQKGGFGFSIDGTNETDPAKTSYLVFYNLPEKIAREIDKVIDYGIGSAVGWESKGRSRYENLGGGGPDKALLLYLFATPD